MFAEAIIHCNSAPMVAFIKKLLQRNTNATIWSLQGIWAAYQTEDGMRQWTVVAVIMTVFAFWFDFSNVERAVLVFATWNIVLMELANTGLETVINRFSDELHPLSKKAKDIGSGMVFFAIVMAAIIWLIIIFA